MTRNVANARRDGHPIEYRWCRVLSAAKFGSRPLLKCPAVTLPGGRQGQCKTWRMQSEFLHLAKFRYRATAAENV